LCQNNAARVITFTRKYDHITPVRRELHWLPVKYRIIFKIAVLTYKALNNIGPLYLKDLLEYTVYEKMELRSESERHLRVPRSRLVTMGSRSFRCAAPQLWNKIPHNIRHSTTEDIFKTQLKTHLFKLAYDID
jgi:hypothetical protein